MKLLNNVGRLVSCLLIIAILFSISGCFLFDYGNWIADKKSKEIFGAMEKNDAEALTQMFSENVRNNTPNFDEDIDKLLDYFEGDIVAFSNPRGGASETTSQTDGAVYHSIELTYDIETSSCDYRFFAIYVLTDDEDQGNVGLSSLYIIKAAEDVDLEATYVGDGKCTPGIHIGVVWEETN